jgi:NhaP-type Na+/H+ or K+/H+ antiporter
VPHSGQDAILFVGISIVAACVLRGKLGTTMLLLSGAALEALTVIPGWTLGRVGNSISWFLSIVPYELFFYIFLPPLLLDAGVRIDYFLFKRALLQVLTAAFLVVGFTTAAMIPLLLYVLRLADRGWGWQHVALLGSMLASTDAVAIINVMKERGGPRRLRVLLEGESLLNDASSFTLFSIFLSYVLGAHGGGGSGSGGNKTNNGAPVGWSVLGDVLGDMLKLAFGGLLFGVAFGLLAHWLLKFMRRHRAGIDQQVALTLAGGYLSFYTANSFHLSGVVAVAVFGLYGASTSTWDLPPASHGAFEAFWDALSFVANSIVFFFTGVREEERGGEREMEREFFFSFRRNFFFFFLEKLTHSFFSFSFFSPSPTNQTRSPSSTSSSGREP